MQNTSRELKTSTPLGHELKTSTPLGHETLESTPIYLRNTPFPMEIFDHPYLISLIAKYYKPKLFIELGTGTGECTKKYIDECGIVCGVDMNRKVIKEVEERKNFLFFQMSTDDFINNNLNEIT